MKILFTFLFLISSTIGFTQDAPTSISLKWAPLGLIPGNISLHGEYNFGKNSLTAKIGIPATNNHYLVYDDKDAEFKMRATSFMAGYRTYLSKKHMKGMYFEPFFKYVHHTGEGVGNSILSGETVVMDFNNSYDGVGVGAQLGVQFLVRKKIVIDLFFFGPEINFSRNKFKAVETSDAIPWTSLEASEAENDIREFIDKFPFIRNKVNVTVDKDNKTVTADFKGAIPGYRAGVSFGIAF
ncbi:MAG TPA: hypothetical protein VGC29_03260 [Flavisolibacter sp.]